MTKLINYTSGPKGVHTALGLVYVNPGETVDVEIEDGELASAKSTGWFSKPKDPLDHDDDGKKGGAAPATDAPKPEATKA